MKVKTRQIKCTNVKPFGTLSPAVWLCSLCFALLPLRLLTSLVGVACANSAVEVVPELKQDVSVIVIDANSVQQRELWRAEIGVTRSGGDAKSSDELKRMIELVRSVTFRSPEPNVEPVAMPFETSPIEPAEPTPDEPVKVEVKPERAAVKAKLPYEPISAETLQMLKGLSTHPDKVDSPFDLAETLFLSGNLKEAAVFYTEAINRTKPNEVDPLGRRAWILFQVGNCLRNSDMPSAAKMYALLITEYPNSPWAQMAQAQAQVIDWYLRDEPQKLIAARGQAGHK